MGALPRRLLPLLALLACASGAFAAPADRKFITLRGRVADATGTPVSDVRIEASGTREAIALTSPDGHYTLTLDLGALNQIQLHPVAVTVRARRDGWRVQVAGGVPELAIELRPGVERGEPVLQARSNFGIIADALLDALALPGDRTATLQVSFRAERGAPVDSAARLPDTFRSVPIPEPWLSTPAAVTTPREPGEPAAPVVKEEAPAPPAARPAAPETSPAEKPAAARVEPEKPARRKEAKVSKRREPKTARPKEPRVARPKPVRPEAPAVTSAPLTPADSARLAREAERRAAIEAAQARRDSVWREQRAQSLERKRVADSLRAIREAAEDSARRARFGLPPRDAPPEGGRADVPALAPAEVEREPEAPRVPSGGGGLQRVGVRDEAASPRIDDSRERAALEADSCTCRVRGTIETEFHRVLTSPLRVEVSIRELPALRDTIELFMGSPRAFEFRRVPCGRWSLALRPFSDKPFAVVTPSEVAPFDCRSRGLRQVRVVIAPAKPGH